MNQQNKLADELEQMIDQAWTDLIDKDDRTSPEEYPDMALITAEELREFMERVTALRAAGSAEPVAWRETAIVGLINTLRADEGDSVTILCDNPDFNGQPNYAIVCNGDWTGWCDRRFAADTILDALSMAMTEKKLPYPRKIIGASNGHHWVERFNLVCCRDCGFVRRADDQSLQCKGPVGIGIRMDLAVHPAPAESMRKVKTVYIKRWRTLIELPAKYADEIVEAMRGAPTPLPQAVETVRKALAAVTIFRVEEQEQSVCIAICGTALHSFPVDQPAGRALLRFEALQRAALSQAPQTVEKAAEPSPIMRAAVLAADRVAGWSDAKLDYAARAVSVGAPWPKEEIEPGRVVDVDPEVLEAAQWAPCSACPSSRFCRHHRVVSCQQAAAAVAEKRATLEDLDQVLSDIYAALGCEHDNEAALIEIHDLKAVAAAEPTREEVAKAIGVALYGESTFMSLNLDGWSLSALLPAADAILALTKPRGGTATAGLPTTAQGE